MSRSSEIRDITARGKLPILVGGTGFYFRALTRGLFPAPGFCDEELIFFRAVGLAAPAPDGTPSSVTTMPHMAEQKRQNERTCIAGADVGAVVVASVMVPPGPDRTTGPPFPRWGFDTSAPKPCATPY